MWYENPLLPVCLGLIAANCLLLWLHFRHVGKLQFWHIRQIDDLEKKLMAKSLGEYQVQKRIEEGKTFPSIAGSDAAYAEIERRRKGEL